MSDDSNYALKSDDSIPEIAAPEFAYQPQFPSDKSTKIGLIGCGGITEQHLTAYKKSGLEVVALCNRTLSKAEKKRDEYFPNATVTSDPDDILSNDEITVVDITYHPELRAEWIEKALKAGKHVLSQKPFILDLDQGQQLADLADQQGKLLAVNQNGRWAPYVRYSQLAIDAGLIGEVQSINVNVCWDHEWVKGTPFETIHHLLLYDFAIHWIDMVCCFMNQPARTAQAMVTKSASQSVAPPLVGSAQLKFDSGIASLHFDGSSKVGPFESIQIIGSKGRISCSGKPCEAHDLQLITKDGIARPQLEGSWMPDGFAGTMGELLSAIDENRQPYHSAKNNLRSLEAAFALIQSADDGKAIPVGTARKVGPNCQPKT